MSTSLATESTMPVTQQIINTCTMIDYFLCKKKGKEENTNEGKIINASRHLFHRVTEGQNKTVYVKAPCKS